MSVIFRNLRGSQQTVVNNYLNVYGTLAYLHRSYNTMDVDTYGDSVEQLFEVPVQIYFHINQQDALWEFFSAIEYAEDVLPIELITKEIDHIKEKDRIEIPLPFEPFNITNFDVGVAIKYTQGDYGYLFDVVKVTHNSPLYITRKVKIAPVRVKR